MLSPSASTPRPLHSLSFQQWPNIYVQTVQLLTRPGGTTSHPVLPSIVYGRPSTHPPFHSALLMTLHSFHQWEQIVRFVLWVSPPFWSQSHTGGIGEPVFACLCMLAQRLSPLCWLPPVFAWETSPVLIEMWQEDCVEDFFLQVAFFVLSVTLNSLMGNTYKTQGLN